MFTAAINKAEIKASIWELLEHYIILLFEEVAENVIHTWKTNCWKHNFDNVAISYFLESFHQKMLPWKKPSMIMMVATFSLQDNF